MISILFITIHSLGVLATIQTPESTIDGIASGVSYLLYPIRGLSSKRKYLSTTSNGDQVDLWHEDDNSGRQKWVIELIGTEGNNGVYNIEPFDGIYETDRRTYLSTTDNGDQVDLWYNDDNSGRQKWVFIKDGVQPSTGLNYFNIRVKNGVSGGRVWLSCTSNGDQVDLWYGDDESGRQQWVIEPLDMRIIDMQYNIDVAQLIALPPVIVGQQELVNGGGLEQTKEFKVEKSIEKTSYFEHQVGVTITVGAEFTAGNPLVGESKTSIEISSSYQHKWGESEKTTDTWSETFPIKVPAYTTYYAVATVKHANLDVPYVATLQSTSTGARVQTRGIWHGVSTYDITYTIEQTIGCALGYFPQIGDIGGWGKINGIGGGQSVINCGQCGNLCSQEALCKSYECSHTAHKCNLNTEPNPSQGSYLDYQFCTRKVN